MGTKRKTKKPGPKPRKARPQVSKRKSKPVQPTELDNLSIAAKIAGNLGKSGLVPQE